MLPVGIAPAADHELLVLDEFLLDPGQPELRVAVVVLVTVPTEQQDRVIEVAVLPDPHHADADANTEIKLCGSGNLVMRIGNVF